MPRTGKITATMLLVCFVVSVTIALAQEQALEEIKKKPLKVGDPAPEFALKDLEGKLVKLADFKNKNALLLVFWSIRCPYCEKGIPLLQDIRLKFEAKPQGKGKRPAQEDKNKLLQVVSICTDKDGDKVAKAYVDKKKWNLKTLLDLDNKVAEAYSVSGTPTSFLIDKKGIVLKIYVGLTKEIVTALDKVLKVVQSNSWQIADLKKFDEETKEAEPTVTGGT